MRIRTCFVAVALFLNLLAANFAAEPLPVGLVDVGHIFKSYKPAAEKLATLKPAVVELERTVQLRNVEIEQIQRKLASPAETDNRGKLQVQLAKLQGELRVFIETERQSLQKRELQIQAEIYKLVQAEVQRIAKERGLKLVVVRPRLSIDSQDAGELARALNQFVIFDDGLDLTDDVLKAMEGKAAE